MFHIVKPFSWLAAQKISRDNPSCRANDRLSRPNPRSLLPLGLILLGVLSLPAIGLAALGAGLRRRATGDWRYRGGEQLQ
ncbi:MAG TPA: hypothetical protein VIT38_13740 [Allosphingosinicella sp.]